MRKKSWAFLKVSGKSMFPWIRENDVVFVRSVSINSMLRGDVAAFERDGILCVHRVLAVVRDSEADGIALITKGDAAGEKDDPLSAAGFRGKVEFVYRGSREIPIASGWRRPFGKLLALISPAIGWCKPAAPSANAIAIRNEMRPSRCFPPHRSAEDSTD